jgi:hypothetical protein
MSARTMLIRCHSPHAAMWDIACVQRIVALQSQPEFLPPETRRNDLSQLSLCVCDTFEHEHLRQGPCAVEWSTQNTPPSLRCALTKERHAQTMLHVIRSFSVQPFGKLSCLVQAACTIGWSPRNPLIQLSDCREIARDNIRESQRDISSFLPGPSRARRSQGYGAKTGHSILHHAPYVSAYL